MKTALRRAAVLTLLAVWPAPSPLRAQSDGVPIETMVQAVPQSVLDEAGRLRDGGRLLDMERIAAQLAAPVPGPVALVPPRSRKLRAREVAGHARAGAVHVGWFYLCKRCEHWHTKLSSAYAIARDAVATCHHCVEPNTEDMREAYFIAVDADGRARAVTAVLARSRTMDAVILRVSGPALTPLALNEDVGPGDTAYCLSDPLGQTGYFSQGIVNRFFWHSPKPGSMESLEELKTLRLNVSTDWAPGSSGAAVLDDSGNVIGHVATISPLSESRRGLGRLPSETPDKKAEEAAAKRAAKAASSAKTNTPPDRFNGATLITLHEAVPARGVAALARAANAAAKTARQ